MHRRAQSSFVVSQVASTLVLLVGAGLLLRTILHLWNVNPGFETQNIVALKVGVSHSRDKNASRYARRLPQLMERIRQIPGSGGCGFYYRRSVDRTGRLLAILARLAEAGIAAGRATHGLVSYRAGLPSHHGNAIASGALSERATTHKIAMRGSDRQQFCSRLFPDGAGDRAHHYRWILAAFGPCAIVGIVNHVRICGPAG